MKSSYHWWQTNIIYQIYPRSYQDSNSDGVGDLPGIEARLDYVQSLNVGAVSGSRRSIRRPCTTSATTWPLSPSTRSSARWAADFDRLLAETHRRGMKLILDLVPNHTSDEHPWFVESRSSRDNPKRDWYIWRDPAPDGGPPNNWLSYFGGPAWTYGQYTGQYYMHQFLTQQPELNYRNPAIIGRRCATRCASGLDRGVDGFRVDVIWLMMKDPLFRDEPPNPAWDSVNPHNSLRHIYTANLPEVHGLIREMRSVLDAYDDRMMVGEIYMPNEDLVTYYGGPDGAECHLPFNFQLINAPWDAATVRRMVDAYEAILPAGTWPNWVLGNHDQHRLATRIGPAQARRRQHAAADARGAPTCYYGDEIGMENVPIPLEMVQDPPALSQPEIAHLVGRDPERTPMQWDASPNAGFAPVGIRTWLPVADDFATRNVIVQSQDPVSMLSFYRGLTVLRQSEPALTVGDYRSLDAGATGVFAYLRSRGDSRFLVVLNLGGEARRLDLSMVSEQAEIVLSTEMSAPCRVALSALDIQPNAGLILRLSADNKETQ